MQIDIHSDASMDPTATMVAAAFHKFGGPDTLQLMRLPRPVANPAEVIVEVLAATVNPTDLLMLAGRQAEHMKDLAPPYVPGMEFSGRIQSVGTDVTGLKPGSSVVGLVNPRRPAGGAQAQFVSVPASSVAVVPPDTDLIAAATIPMNGSTAKLCMDALGRSPGEVILVTGAAGAVGGYVVQFAKQAGLRVVADARGADVEWLREIGVDDIVPRGPDWAAAVQRIHPRGVDGLVDAALLGDAAAALVRDGGSVALLRSSQAGQDSRLQYRHISVLKQATGSGALSWLAEQIRGGKLRSRIAANMPLERVQEAYALVEKGGLQGKVVLYM